MSSSSISNDSIRIGGFFTVTSSDLSTKRYTIFRISPNRIIGYYPLDVKDQLSLLYDNEKKEWTPSPEIIDNITDISTIAFVENLLLQYLNGIRLIDVVELFPNKPWDYIWLSKNPNITFQDVLENPELPWNYDTLSKNPNITMASSFIFDE